MIPLCLALIAAAIGLVRLGWGGRRGAAAAGWLIGLAALAGLAMSAGAWGLAAGTLAGMISALMLVLLAGLGQPRRTARTARLPVARAPAAGPPGLARRIAVFALVVPCSFAAAVVCAIGAQALARSRGSAEADAVVLTLLLQPVVWAALMSWQMTRSGPAAMIAPPLLAATTGALLWSAS